MASAWIANRNPGILVRRAMVFAMAWMLGVAFAKSSPLVFSNLDSLFLTAAAGEPRLKAARDSCEKMLVARGSETVAYLLNWRSVDHTPRQRHYVERLIGLLSDSGRQAYVGVALRMALTTAPDSIKPQMLYIASTMADTQMAEVGSLYIAHTGSESSTDIRRMAARILGAYPRASHAKPLLNGLAEAPEAERHQRLWALAAVAPYPGCDGLKTHLHDSSLAVRQMTIQALKRCAEGNFAKLNLTLPKPLTGETLPTRPYLAWLELALAFESPEAKAFAKALLARLPSATRKYYPLSLSEVR